MSLAVDIGVLAEDDADPEGLEWYREQFREVNRVLAANGLPPHEEPERLSATPVEHALLSFPYTWLHYLRRAVAYARQAPEEFCPLEEDAKPAEDERVDEELSIVMESHLICHSDCEGFYVPIDFPTPLYDDEEDGLVGGILGSSLPALREVILAAPLLGITLDGEDLSDEAAQSIAEEEEGSHAFWIERQVWLTMYEAFRNSVRLKCAVVFN